MTIVGIQFGYLLGGTVIVEEIFALPGMGRLVLTGIAQREYAVVQSSVLVIAAHVRPRQPGRRPASTPASTPG